MEWNVYLCWFSFNSQKCKICRARCRRVIMVISFVPGIQCVLVVLFSPSVLLLGNEARTYRIKIADGSWARFCNAPALIGKGEIRFGLMLFMFFLFYNNNAVTFRYGGSTSGTTEGLCVFVWGKAMGKWKYPRSMKKMWRRMFSVPMKIKRFIFK